MNTLKSDQRIPTVTILMAGGFNEKFITPTVIVKETGLHLAHLS
ncbi:hypothetical protein [Leisingera sp. JC1]|nr:hypothetical protein [Leisingera sp. JC1]